MESKDDNKENTSPLDLIEMNDELRTQPEDSPPLIDNRPMHMDTEPEEDSAFQYTIKTQNTATVTCTERESRWEPIFNFKRQREEDEKEEGASYKVAKVLASLDDMQLM